MGSRFSCDRRGHSIKTLFVLYMVGSDLNEREGDFGFCLVSASPRNYCEVSPNESKLYRRVPQVSINSSSLNYKKNVFELFHSHVLSFKFLKRVQKYPCA